MADQKFDNTKLEEAVEAFVQDRQKDKYAAVMGILEKSMILMPTMKPEGLDEETEKLMKEGKPVQLPKETKIMPCLLRNEAGGQALPIFTSTAQIPDDRKSPALMGLPFFGCLSIALAEVLDGIPIFARRVKLKMGVSIAVLAVALGKIAGSLVYFVNGFFEGI